MICSRACTLFSSCVPNAKKVACQRKLLTKKTLPPSVPTALPSTEPSKAPTSDDSVAFTETPVFYGIIAVVAIVVIVVVVGSGVAA